MTELLSHAFNTVRRLDSARQDDIARAMLALAGGEEPKSIDPAGIAAALEGLAQAKRREFATLEQVEAACQRLRRPRTAAGPTADDIVATLRANEKALRERGVGHAALFGTRARVDYRPGGGIGILIETDPAAVRTGYDYASVKLAVEDLFPLPTGVIDRAFLKPSIRPVAELHLIYAF